MPLRTLTISSFALFMAVVVVPVQAWQNANVAATNTPAPVLRPLQPDLPIVTVMPSATTITPTEAQLAPVGTVKPAETVSTVEALKPLPTEMQLREQARREAEARRPPPLVLKSRPQKIETISDGNFLITPQDAPLRTNSTVAGNMFNDNTELSIPQPDTKFTALTAPQSLPPLVPSTSTAPLPSAPNAIVPAKLPAPLTLNFTADITQLTSAQRAQVAAWARQVPAGAKVTATTYNETPPLGATLQEIGAARWNKTLAALKQSNPALKFGEATHQAPLALKGKTLQRLVIKAVN